MTNRGLVLSLFPGIDLLGRAFEAQGWCVVWGPDVIYARDIRGWRVPAGRFDGIIGGPPCQSFSALANIVRANGYEPRFGDLHPEYCRVVSEAQPWWWLCENVPKAPDPVVPGYHREQFHLSPRWLGDTQSRLRKFTFGQRRMPEFAPQGYAFRPAGIEARLPVVALEPVDFAYAQTGGSRERPVKLGGSGKVKAGLQVMDAAERKRRHGGALATNRKNAAAAAAAQGWPGLDAELREQGLFSIAGICHALGNGVPRIMAEAIARAIGEWLDETNND